jgi:septal ring factor EnvC (AmiA/AmiB activator)
MTQAPITVTYSLEEILGQIQQQLVQLNDKIDEQSKKSDEQFKRVDEQLQTMHQEITAVKIHVIQSEANSKGEMEGLKAEAKGIGKRLDTQEFINRSVVAGFVLAVVAGIVKLFLPTFPPS